MINEVNRPLFYMQLSLGVSQERGGKKWVG